MKFEYKTIDVSTIPGIKKAEKLQAEGWTVLNVGINTIQFIRPKNKG